MVRRVLKLLVLFVSIAALVCLGGGETYAQKPPPRKNLQPVKPADREKAADRAAKKGLYPGEASKYLQTKVGMSSTASNMDPGGIPHYFGPYPNYANSPMPWGRITSITLENGGSGYSATPTVTIADVYGTGFGATATASVTGGTITALTLTYPGMGYTAPYVIITDPTGVDAFATARIGGSPGSLYGGIRKFMDSLPSLPVAVPEPCNYSGQDADCYVVELREYTQKMHTDLAPTKLRGYVQVRSSDGQPVAPIQYLGPTIVATKDKPVRVTFRNKLPTGAGGDLFIPVDTTVMGAGDGPTPGGGGLMEQYTENRATLHLHGGLVPWISDGTPHQWTTPAGETTSYPWGVSVYNVPDMPNPGRAPVQGELTFFYNNQQSARLMFYHDHSYGITRLNVYAGEAAGYLITDQVEQDLINGTNNSGANPTNAKVLPDLGIPLIIQDKTFLDPTTMDAQDPTWPFALPAVPVVQLPTNELFLPFIAKEGAVGGAVGKAPQAAAGPIWPSMLASNNLWYPHVYMPNQNPADIGGMNAFGRWAYTPWFFPPTTNISHPPVANPYYDCGPSQPCTRPWENATMPGVPNLSAATEAFMDTPVVNGMAYPYMEVDPKTYRFRVLNAADDRFFNLQLYVADPTVVTADGRRNTEVKLVPYPQQIAGYPAGYMVPDSTFAGPSFIQLGTEGGFLPKPVVLPNKPIQWNGDQTNFDMGVVNGGTLILGPAERADVLVDFSAFAGKTLILYNDAPAPFPALDVRYDYYTGKGDHTDTGGTPDTQPGFGPNTRTVMQIRVKNVAPATPYNLAALESVFAKTATKRGVFEVSQEPVIIPNSRYNSAYNATFPSENQTRVTIYDWSKTFKTISGATLTIPFEKKAIHDEASAVYDDYGRMSGMLGLTNPQNGTFLAYPFQGPPLDIIGMSMTPMTEPSPGDNTQIWRITHNGVDTHPIHFHQFNVQLINRVAWDNAIRLPDPNELGWKETVRINPLQDTIVALRPVAPLNQPFRVPNSERVHNPAQAPGDTLMGPLLNGWQRPDNQQGAVVLNEKTNVGWEYVWHCHILAHEEMDMMHSLTFALAPEAPQNLAGIVNGTQVALTWTDDSATETRFAIQRTDNISGTWTTIDTVLSNDRPGWGATLAYTDTAPLPGTSYYRVLATNLVGGSLSSGFTQPSTAGWPTLNAESLPSNVFEVAAGGVGGAPKVNLGAKVGVAVPPPPAPAGLSAKAIAGTSVDQVKLEWTYAAKNATSFEIQRSKNQAFTADVVTTNGVAGNLTTFMVTNVPKKSLFYYRIRAISAAGPSAWSNIVSITTP